MAEGMAVAIYKDYRRSGKFLQKKTAHTNSGQVRASLIQDLFVKGKIYQLS